MQDQYIITFENKWKLEAFQDTGSYKLMADRFVADGELRLIFTPTAAYQYQLVEFMVGSRMVKKS